MPRVLRTPEARQDLLGIWVYVAENSVASADRLLEAINAQCETLAEFPQMGRRREELSPGMRSFVVGSYVVFYRVIEDGVDVIRVLHGARDIGAIFGA